MTPAFFPAPADFRTWLEANHGKETELLVGFYKVASGKPSLTWSQSVDEALCFGWIDGVRKSIDAESYSIRFAPRKARSIWSAVNSQKIEVLTRQGLVNSTGLAAFEKREESRSKIYAHEQKSVSLSDALEIVFKANEKAWTFFLKHAPSYKNRLLTGS